MRKHNLKIVIEVIYFIIDLVDADNPMRAELMNDSCVWDPPELFLKEWGLLFQAEFLNHSFIINWLVIRSKYKEV